MQVSRTGVGSSQISLMQFLSVFYIHRCQKNLQKKKEVEDGFTTDVVLTMQREKESVFSDCTTTKWCESQDFSTFGKFVMLDYLFFYFGWGTPRLSSAWALCSNIRKNIGFCGTWWHARMEKKIAKNQHNSRLCVKNLSIFNFGKLSPTLTDTMTKKHRSVGLIVLTVFLIVRAHH
jgi:hypothetical protein